MFFVPNRLSKYIFYPLWDIYDRSQRLNEFRTLERSQWQPFSPEAQWTKLKEALSYAFARCSYYRNMKMNVPRSIEEFETLPLLQKRDLRASQEKLVSDEFEASQLIQSKTGGSTGVSLDLYFDKRCQEKRNAAAFRSDAWAGWQLGDPKGALWGNPPSFTTLKQKGRNAFMDRTVYLDTVALNEASLREFVRKIQNEKIHFLFGHAHSLYVFAKFVDRRVSRPLDIRGIVSTSMTLLSSEREVIERVFGCRVTNRYGCEEVGLIASECERHEGLHINTDHVYVEFLTPDGSPVKPGEEGLIVVTDLINRGMPLIRYVVGDVGVPSNRLCPCGRGLPLMERVSGRTADFLIKTDGSLVAGVSLIERTLTAIPGLAQLQIIQNELQQIDLHVVPDPHFTTASQIQLVKEMERVFGDNVRINVHRSSELKQEKNGKFRFSICNVKKDDDF